MVKAAILIDISFRTSERYPRHKASSTMLSGRTIVAIMSDTTATPLCGYQRMAKNPKIMKDADNISGVVSAAKSRVPVTVRTANPIIHAS